ncbi:MAG: 2-dehydro-3-deoxygluconokinase [Chloroflexi bacterium]|nr:2-dehydro-3-deoxygluconokinase [Chloroflexota bacterium]|tara:strand:- start:1085 stop:2110 length:1026 start_codon:yes stop_codon:yes gene_type:complete
MSSVVTFGEIMLRLSTDRRERFTQARNFEVTYGGGECNVAVSLSHFGIDTTFVSAIPDNDIGQACINYIRQFGVKTNEIIRTGQRLGIYFLESGASMRASKVIYDRTGSSIAEIKPGQIDWEEIFNNKKWFHFTGITPAISSSAAETCLEAAKAAVEMGLIVSADMNYRKNLWSSEKAQSIMKPLMKFVDIVIGNEEDAEKCLGISAKNINVTSGEIDPEAYKPVVQKLLDEFNFKKIAITLRESLSADDNNWSAIYFDGKNLFFGKKYPVRIVDRVGGGDAFAAGIIYGNLQEEWVSQQILDFAVASSAISHTFHGDFNLVSLEEVNSVVKGDISGRVQR